MLVEKLQADFPQFNFKCGTRFSFRFPKTIQYPAELSNYFDLELLHELGHATLGHRDFPTDIKRLKMESDAWEQARFYARQYKVEIDEDFIESELDTYRDWLHTKSKCKKCGLTRFQTPDGAYHCPHCDIKQ